MNRHVTSLFTSRPLRNRNRARLAFGTMGATVALVAGAALAPGASAAFSPYVPTTTKYAGDCSATVGAWYAGAGGAAYGNSAVQCNNAHSTITGTVTLYRKLYTGGGWVAVSQRSQTFYNAGGFRDLVTNPGICGPGAYWYTRLDFTVSGVGSYYVMPATGDPYDPCGAN